MSKEKSGRPQPSKTGFTIYTQTAKVKGNTNIPQPQNTGVTNCKKDRT
jgi:hypothetical protein